MAAKTDDVLEVLAKIAEIHCQGRSACSEIGSAKEVVASVEGEDGVALCALLEDLIMQERQIAPWCPSINEVSVTLNQGLPVGYVLMRIRERIERCNEIGANVRMALSHRIDALFEQQREMLAA